MTNRGSKTSRYDALPDENTDEGALARLLIVEVGPQHGDLSTLQEAMGLMKTLIQNRLKNNPKDFEAPNATNETDIIRAARSDGKKVQFAGFPGYPEISPPQKKELDDTLDASIDSTKLFHDRSLRVVSADIAVAKAHAPPDPSPYGLYFWRTHGHPLGSPNYKLYRTIACIDFYQKAQPTPKTSKNFQSVVRFNILMHDPRRLYPGCRCRLMVHSSILTEDPRTHRTATLAPSTAR